MSKRSDLVWSTIGFCLIFIAFVTVSQYMEVTGAFAGPKVTDEASRFTIETPNLADPTVFDVQDKNLVIKDINAKAEGWGVVAPGFVVDSEGNVVPKWLNIKEKGL
jgi:hypothetical protein